MPRPLRHQDYNNVRADLRKDLRPFHKAILTKNIPIANLKKYLQTLFCFSTRNPLHAVAVVVNVIFITYLVIFLQQNHKPRYAVAKSRLQVRSDLENMRAAEEYLQKQADEHPPPPIPEFLVAEWKTNKPVLILSKNMNRKTDKDIVNFLDSFHVNYFISQTLPKPHLLQVNVALIIMTDLSYLSLLPSKDQKFLKEYCVKNNVGLLVISATEDASDVIEEASHFNLPLQVYKANNIVSYQVTRGSSILRATKPGPVIREGLPTAEDTFAAFRLKHSSLRQFAVGKDADENLHITGVEDPGQIDGVKKVIIGYGLTFWINNFLFVDAMHHLANGTFKFPLQRYITVDIDDVFRGEVGNNGLTSSDVWNLINITKEMRLDIKNFRFGLLFCGSGYARHVKQEDIDAHNVFLEHKEMFQWFDHTYNHINVSEPSYSQQPSAIVKEMQKNRAFAKEVGIPVRGDYFVTKAHTGVFPPVDNVYKVFNQMGVKVTGSDRYARVKKHGSHRNAGFIHQGVAALPRIELAGINSVVETFGDYVGGYASFLIHVYRFVVEVLRTPVSLQFIHYRNFGKDRVGCVALKKYVNILKKWTNLELIAQEPIELMKSYFDFYPEDKTPLWQHPCSDPKIRVLWDYTRDCENFPNLMLIGPEQTGSNVLSWLLALHPALRTANETFSDGGGVHFLDRQYHRGITWYHDKFNTSLRSKPDSTILFERTDTYLQKPNMAEKALNIMYHGRVLVTLSDPIMRAFRTFKAEVARKHVPSNYSFYSVIASSNTAPAPIRLLKAKILNPGLYIQYIQSWGIHFKYENMIFVDADKILTNTQAVLDQICDELDIDHYSLANKFRVSKKEGGRLCRGNSNMNCISIKELVSNYPIPENAKTLLKTYYIKSNKALAAFYDRHHLPTPNWLNG